MLTRRQVLILLTALALAPAPGLRAGPMDAQMVVANRNGASISFLDVGTGNVTTVPLPAGANTPQPMYAVYSPANDLVFVGDRGNNRVVAFNARTYAPVGGNIPTGSGVFHMWGDPRQNQLWVNNDAVAGRSITVIDMLSRAVLTTIPTPGDLGAAAVPHDVILDPVAPFAYVTILNADGPNDFVVKYSTDTFLEVDRQPVGQDPHVVLSRHDNRLYVASQNSNELEILDRGTLNSLQKVTIPNAHGVGLTSDGRILYLTGFPGNGVNGLTVFDTVAGAVLNTVNAPTAGTGPHNIGLSPDNTRLFITNTGAASNTVSIFDISGANRTSPVFLGAATTGLNPFGIAVVQGVPEPTTLALALAGGAALAGLRRLRRLG